MGAVLAAGAVDTTSATAALTTAIKMAANAATAVSAAATFTTFSTVTLVAPLYTGIGGLLDPNFWYQSNVPQVGDTILYDPTFITVEPNGEIVSTTNNCSAIVQFNDGSGWAVGLIVITPLMVAYADDATTASGALTAAIQLAGAASSVSSAIASLSTQTNLQGAASTLTSATAALTTTIQMLATALDTTSGLGFIPGGQAQLAAAAATVTSSNTVLTAQIQMASAAASVTSAIGDVVTAIQMAGSAANATSAMGSLFGVPTSLAGSAESDTAASGDIVTQTLLGAAAQDLTSASVSMQTQILLMGAAVDVVTSDPDLKTNNIPVAPYKLFKTSPTRWPWNVTPQPYAEEFQAFDSVITYGIDWTGLLASRWEPGSVALGVTVLPLIPNGLQATCTLAGFAGAQEPQWPAFEGGIVNDGSAQWTMEAVDQTSLAGTIAEAVWTVPAGINLIGWVVPSGTQLTLVTFDTSDAAIGTDYDCTVTVSLAGPVVEEFVGKIRLKVR